MGTRALATALVVYGAGLDGGHGADSEGGIGTPADHDIDGGAIPLSLSDEETDIDDFAHLNATITLIGFKRVRNGDGNTVDNKTVAGEADGKRDPGAGPPDDLRPRGVVPEARRLS